MPHSERELIAESDLSTSRFLENFFRGIRGYTKTPSIQKALESAPESLIDGRSFTQIVADDALSVFEDIMASVAQNQTPTAAEPDTAKITIYQILLRSRHDKDFTKAEAQNLLNEAIKKKSSDARVKVLRLTPDYIEIMKGHLSPRALKRTLDSWAAIVSSFNKLFQTQQSLTAQYTTQAYLHGLESEIQEWSADDAPNDADTENYMESLLEKFTINVLLEAKDTAHHTLVRPENLRSLMAGLLNEKSPQSLIVGEPGEGKSALVHSLAHLIQAKEAPPPLQNARIHRLHLRDISIATNFIELFQDILELTAAHNARNKDQIILEIDETEELDLPYAHWGLAQMVLENSLDNNPTLRVILETTPGFAQHMNTNMRKLERHFHRIDLTPLSEEEVIARIEFELEALQKDKKIKHEKGLAGFLYRQASDLWQDSALPGAALDILNIAVAEAVVDGADKLTIDGLATIIAERTGVSKELIVVSETDRIANLREKLPERVLGQPCVARIASNLEIAMAGLASKNKTLGAFLLTGETGVGKTETGRALADLLGMGAPVRIDMANYAEPHAVARLLGSPPGYVGFNQPSELAPIIENPYAVVILDEVEKAHPRIMNTMLSGLEEGEIKLANGEVVDLRRCLILLTSNLGAQHAAEKKSTMGFGDPQRAPAQQAAETEQKVMEAVRAFFKPEFLGRLDDVLHYNALSADISRKIMLKKVDEVSQTLREKYQNVRITLQEPGLERLLADGFNRNSGGRNADKAIHTLLKAPLATWLIREGRHLTKPVIVSFTAAAKAEDGLTFTVNAAKNDNRKRPPTDPTKKAAATGARPTPS